MTNLQKTLDKIYYNPKTGLVGINKLLDKAKELHPEEKWSQEIINTYIKSQKTSQIFAKKKKVNIPITAPYKSYNYQADLMDVSRWSRQNKGIHFLLCVVDIYSRYAWIYPLKNKTAKSVSESLDDLFSNNPPKKITTDNGKEFLNSEVNRIMKKYSVSHHSNEPGDHNKLGIIERFNRTVRELIAKYQVAADSYTYIDVIDDLVNNYNNHTHSTIKAKPIDVWNGKSQPYIERDTPDLSNYEIGTNVRILEPTTKFSKSSDPKWSDEIYTIRARDGNRLLLSDKRKKFSVNELQPIYLKPESNKIVTSHENKKIKNDRNIERSLKRDGIDSNNIIDPHRPQSHPHRTLRNRKEAQRA